MQDSKLSRFHEGIGICEQIMGTPIPVAYTRLTSRLLVLWHLTLPVTLWDECRWIVVPATFISAACLFCIEEVFSLAPLRTSFFLLVMVLFVEPYVVFNIIVKAPFIPGIIFLTVDLCIFMRLVYVVLNSCRWVYL